MFFVSRNITGKIVGEYIYFCLLPWFFILLFLLHWNKQSMESESCGRTDFTWQAKSAFVKSDGHSWTCLKIRKFFTVNVPYLPENEEYKWVSYDYSWVKEWDNTDEVKRHYLWKITFEYCSNLLPTLTAEDFPDILTGQKDTAITRFL